MWLHPTPYGSPHSTGLRICKTVAEFTGRECKTRRCDCIQCSAHGKMKKEFCASRGAAAQGIGGEVSGIRTCDMAPGGMNEDSLTGRALA
jgi:hypothetical protein